MGITLDPNDPAFGPPGSVDQQEWAAMLKRHQMLVDQILSEGQNFAGQAEQQGLINQPQAQQPQTPIPLAGQQQTSLDLQGNFLHAIANWITGGQQATQGPRPAAIDELIGQARAWGIPNPEGKSPAELEDLINQFRAGIPRDQQTSLGSASLALLGMSSEAGGAASRVVGNIFGDVGSLPFVGETLGNILGTEKAKRFMYDLSQRTSEFTEVARAAQPKQDLGAFQMMTVTGKLAGQALPAMALWNAIGAAGGVVPEAWAARASSPIFRAALQGGLTGGVMEAGSDEPTTSKVFSIGTGMFLGGATALPIVGASLGLGALGAGLGGQVGDTPQERRTNAIVGGIAGVAMGALPILIPAGAKVRNDMPGPVDSEINGLVRQQPTGDDPQAVRARATARIQRQIAPPGPDYTTQEPQLTVRAEPPQEAPQPMGGMTQQPVQSQALPLPGATPEPAPMQAARGGKLDGTKVVDDQGQPLTVYHGTNVDFQAFMPTADSRMEDGGLFGPGFYHTDNPEVASSYAFNGIPDLEFDTGEPQSPGYSPQVRPAKLNIQNPFDMDRKMSADEVGDLVDKVEAVTPGYDWATVKQSMQSWIQARGPQRGQDVYTGLYRALPDTRSTDALRQEQFFGQPMDIVGKPTINASLEKLGYDGIVGRESPVMNWQSHVDENDPNAYKVWVAFRPSQVHSPWDATPQDIQGAAVQGDATTKQAIIMESQNLPSVVNKSKITDADVVDAAYGANPAGISIIRGLTRPMDVSKMAINSDQTYFVKRGDTFDAMVGNDISYYRFKEYQDYGVFTGQKVVTATGHEGEISKIGDLITVKRSAGPPLRVRPENILPSRQSGAIIEAPQLYDDFKTDMLLYSNDMAQQAGMSPIESMTDPRVASILHSHLNDFMNRQGIGGAMRQVVEDDVGQRWVQEFKNLDPEMRDVQSAAVSDAVTAHNNSEESNQDYIPTSLEEKAEKRGYTFVAYPGEGGTMLDTVNPGSPDVPLATDAAAHEFLARVDRTLPDYTIASDVPMDVAEMLPTELGRDPSLPTEHFAESLNNTVNQLGSERTPEAADELARQLLPTTTPTAPPSPPTGIVPTGGGNYLPPEPPGPPSGGAEGGQPILPPGSETLGGQFDRMRRTDPAKLHDLVGQFTGFMSSKARYIRYGMMNLETRLTEAGIDLGKAWQHYNDLTVAKVRAYNEAAPWIKEYSNIMRQFPGRILRDGTVTRIHEITDPNARAAAWYRTMESHNLSEPQVQRAMRADDQMTDWWHRIFQSQTNDPQSALTAEREIFRYMPEVRARQAQGVPDPYKTDQSYLSPEVQFFAEHARDGNLQFRVTDARELGTRYVNAMTFKKYASEPWQNLVSAWQDPRIPQPLQDYMLDWARIVRHGYDPRGELATRGVQSVMGKFGVKLTPREAQHLLNAPTSAMYLSMLGGRMSIFFRDATQPLLALAKVRLPYMTGVYKDVLAGAGRMMSSAEQNTLRDMYQRGLQGGWVERENPNIEAASIFEEPGGSRENELRYLTPAEANRREMLARIGDVGDQLPAWLSRPSQSNISTLKWYGRQGQLHRLIVGEAAYRQATDALAGYRQSQVGAVLNRNPALEQPYDLQNGKLLDNSLENQSFFGSFEQPIRTKLKELVDGGSDEEAAQLFARQVADWSQFRYGRREVPPILRSNIGRMLFMFGNFTGQFLEGMTSSLANGSPMHKARYAMTVGAFSAAMYELKHLTGWGFDKWAWVPNAEQFLGGPMLEKGSRAVAALTGIGHQVEGQQASDFETAAMKEEAQGGILPSMSDFLPYTGYVRSGAEYAGALQGANPGEQVARYTITGDRGSRVDMQRMIEDAAAKQDILRGQIAPGSQSPNGGLMPGLDETGFHWPTDHAVQFPHGTNFPGAGAQ